MKNCRKYPGISEKFLIMLLLLNLTFKVYAQQDKPVIHFEYTKYSTGVLNLKKDSVVHIAFPFFNEGGQPLVILSVKTSCNCTIADYPRHSIPRNKKDVIKVEFRPAGEGFFERILFVRTNAANHTIALEITGEIRP
jgi:hypothetical protein